jgi:uncharacterized protein YcbK (DUF882 family)
MLTIKKRQTYLKELGYYSGKVDGKEKKLTKAAYLALQKDYFVREEDIDGYYGKNTDILLQNAYNVKKYCKNFKLEEFRCNCVDKKKEYCTGYPAILDVHLLKYLQEIRNDYGATTIRSGMRCQKYNDQQKGSSKTSKHITGKAIDFYNKRGCATHELRKQTVDKCIKKLFMKYAYCDDYARTKTRKTYPNANNMGNSIHINV